MLTTSTVGMILDDREWNKIEWTQGEKIDGFEVPFNIQGDIHSLARRFGLWQSTNGINIPGVEHTPLMGGVHMIQTKAPVLVGDFVNGKQVLSSTFEYFDRYDYWQCEILYGKIESIEREAQKYDCLEAIAQADSDLAEKIVKLVQNIFEQALPLCFCPENANLKVEPAMGVVRELLYNARTDLNEIVKQEREKQWH